MEARGWSLVLSDGLGQFLDPFLETASVMDRARAPHVRERRHHGYDLRMKG